MTTMLPQLAERGAAGDAGGARPVGMARGQVWPWAVAALAGLIYLVWAGSSYDPRKISLWMFKPLPDGWIAPAPGIGHLMFAVTLAFAALSMVAWRAARQRQRGGGHSRLWQVVIIGLIAVMALDLRLAVLRSWMPLVLDPAVIGARAYHPQAPWRGPAILADMVTLGILCLALGARGNAAGGAGGAGGGNYWLAALFALHPLAIIESAANGSAVSLMLPALALVVMGWRFHAWVRELVVMGSAAACTWWVAHLALGGQPFNGVLAECLGSLGLDGRDSAAWLIAIEMILQAAVVVLAFRRGWNLARTLGHILLAWAIVSPRVMPADVLPILVLLPLGWTRAGWVLSGTILGTYAMLGLYARATPWQMPAWLVFLMMLPVVVVEVEELVWGDRQIAD